MPPTLASILTFVFTCAVLWYLGRHRDVNRALWLPVLWVFFVASKFPSQWLQVFGLWNVAAGSVEEGSPLDAAFFLVLILLGMAVLVRRNIDVIALFRSNLWLTAFFAYCLVSILWSDFPVVALKRWIKVLGHPVMALVILTDANPRSALRSVFQRAAVLMLPWSILFIKYYPHLGRYFDLWTGAALSGGIHHNKNELGYTCMVLGIFFFWNLLSARRLAETRWRRREMLLSVMWLGMVWWLLSDADSATSLVCMLAGVLTAAVVGSRIVSRRFIGVQLMTVLVVALVMEMTFGIYGHAIELLGRNPTLTDRTEIWADLLAFDINPVVGAGFESFWLGERREALWQKWWWHPNQAHNGYIETYLNLGWLGVALLAGLLFVTYRKGRAALLRDVDEGRLRLAFLFAIVIYNYTEATFKGVHLVWTVFHLIAIDYPVKRSEQMSAASTAPAPSPGAKQRALAPAARVAAPLARAPIRPSRPLTHRNHP